MARFGRLGDYEGRQTVRFSRLGGAEIGLFEKKQLTVNS